MSWQVLVLIAVAALPAFITPPPTDPMAVDDLTSETEDGVGSESVGGGYWMLQLDEVTLRHDQAKILDRVNLEIVDGDFVVVAGRTGSGKSTLLGVMSGLVPTFTGGHLSGDIRWDGESVISLPPGREHTGLARSVRTHCRVL
ncbi:MAG: ATP-binding cassette domain-containing protein [Marmoricola sp.]